MKRIDYLTALNVEIVKTNKEIEKLEREMLQTLKVLEKYAKV
ncbi:hypothetical protein ELUMI_v1c05410 [Williamsoniiplasma luminosum]|uniref:Uncharacterized protein n=1 Tax=Williamsoniiplasma luminosum TaxID=214888 RepID=A0A2K8NTT5_9MOLU|nr:hypothetical protein [Williamsoniiplasma luminosum]ATZ17265.1 hypothetical protein ELUMI_v1c05410 [Williamsoniiplasma luminosum]